MKVSCFSYRLIHDAGYSYMWTLTAVDACLNVSDNAHIRPLSLILFSLLELSCLTDVQILVVGFLFKFCTHSCIICLHMPSLELIFGLKNVSTEKPMFSCPRRISIVLLGQNLLSIVIYTFSAIHTRYLKESDVFKRKWYVMYQTRLLFNDLCHKP